VVVGVVAPSVLTLVWVGVVFSSSAPGSLSIFDYWFT
jgi:hypothetical protein